MRKYVVRGKTKEEILKKIATHFDVEVAKVKYEVLREEKNEIELKTWIESDKRPLNSEIYIQKDGIFIKIFPSNEELELLKKYVIIEIENKEIKDYSKDALDNALSEQGRTVKIAEYDPSYYIDGQFIIEILSPLEAAIQLIPPKRGNMPTLENIKEGCKSKQIIFGIREKAVKTMLENKIFNTKVVLAKAKPQINGIDGKLIYHFDRSKNIKLADSEAIDYKNLNWVKNIKQGDLLVEKIPGIPGKPGINIFGKVIPVKPIKEAKLPKGRGTYVEGAFLKSEIDGQISEEGESKISIIPVLTISGDVDYSTGNIEFVGSVVISKNVLTGFSVKASEDIIVEGLVEDAILEAKRDVIVAKGIVASEEGEGHIYAGNDVRSKFIQNMKVRARGDVVINDYIMLGDVEARGMVECTQGKGKIINGHIKSQKSIRANVIGGRYETHTNLEIGVFSDIAQQEKEFDNKIHDTESKKEQMEMALRAFMKKSESVRSALRTKEQELRSGIETMRAQLNELESEKRKLVDEYSGITKGKIEALKELNPGVIVKMGKHIYVNKDSKLHSIFTIDEENGKIQCT